jgi:PilZ domain-containing protein
MQENGFASLHNSSAEAVMTGAQLERRRKKRTLVRLPVWIQIQLQHSDLHRHVGMVRDMNRKGIFFYSDFASSAGSELEFVLRFPAWTNSPPIACKGKVVRVQKAPVGAVYGVAVSLSRYRVLA